MAEKMFMRVGEVAESLDVSKPYAYKLIRDQNEKLKKKLNMSATLDTRRRNR